MLFLKAFDIVDEGEANKANCFSNFVFYLFFSILLQFWLTRFCIYLHNCDDIFTAISIEI